MKEFGILVIFILTFFSCGNRNKVKDNDTFKISNIKNGFYSVSNNDSFIYFLRKKNNIFQIDGNIIPEIHQSVDIVELPISLNVRLSGDEGFGKIETKPYTFNKSKSNDTARLANYIFVNDSINSTISIKQIDLKNINSWAEKIKIQNSYDNNIDSIVIISNKLVYTYYSEDYKSKQDSTARLMLRIPSLIEDNEQTNFSLFLFTLMNKKPQKTKDGFYKYLIEIDNKLIEIYTYFEIGYVEPAKVNMGIDESKLRKVFFNYL